MILDGICLKYLGTTTRVLWLNIQLIQRQKKNNEFKNPSSKSFWFACSRKCIPTYIIQYYYITINYNITRIFIINFRLRTKQKMLRLFIHRYKCYFTEICQILSEVEAFFVLNGIKKKSVKTVKIHNLSSRDSIILCRLQSELDIFFFASCE